jgi:hypothetical protein
VIRVTDASGRLVKIFTRVQPGSRSTSIIIRVREGWEELRRNLVPDMAAPRVNPLEAKRR